MRSFTCLLKSFCQYQRTDKLGKCSLYIVANFFFISLKLILHPPQKCLNFHFTRLKAQIHRKHCFFFGYVRNLVNKMHNLMVYMLNNVVIVSACPYIFLQKCIIELKRRYFILWYDKFQFLRLLKIPRSRVNPCWNLLLKQFSK